MDNNSELRVTMLVSGCSSSLSGRMVDGQPFSAALYCNSGRGAQLNAAEAGGWGAGTMQGLCSWGTGSGGGDAMRWRVVKVGRSDQAMSQQVHLHLCVVMSAEGSYGVGFWPGLHTVLSCC
jgi:hypothetical protein